jgi:uncharacterized membrane protein YedE/YeeE
MHKIIALISGGLFGIGLYISQMTNTRKVQGWLDIFGDWDPTLTFVMGGAIIPMFFAWKIINKREKTFTGCAIPPRISREINQPLIIGSVLFGVGWGLAGLCPGPAIASLSFGESNGVIFLIAMISGMFFISKVLKI